MTTIKSYTDLSQSRKLAEFLPLESADMCWTKYVDNGDVTSLHATINYGIVTIDYPCWSLSALLDMLPEGTRLLKSATDDTYHCGCPKGNVDKWFDNPVDACVEMIMRLNKLQLL